MNETIQCISQRNHLFIPAIYIWFLSILFLMPRCCTYHTRLFIVTKFEVVIFEGYSCDICVSIPWCPSFGWRNGRDGYCLGNVRLSGWSFVAEKHRASSVGQPDRPLMTPHVSPVDFPLASVVFVVCLFVFAKVWHQKATSEVFLPGRSALSLYIVVGSVVFIVWKTLVSKLSHDIQQCVAYSFPSGQCSPSSFSGINHKFC